MGPLRFKFSVSLLLTGLIVMATQGCVKQPPSPAEPAPTPVAYMYHTVKYSGETLSLIADWYTGSARNWEVILKENPGLNPKRIRKGDVIIIPRSLVTKSEPLPERFLRPKQPAKVVEPPPVKKDFDADLVDDGASSPASEHDISPETAPEASSPAPADEPPAVLRELDSVNEAPEATIPPAPTSEPAVAIEPTEVPPAPATAVPTADKRIKSREELLKELLAE